MRGYAFLIGVDTVDQERYSGDTSLNFCPATHNIEMIRSVIEKDPAYQGRVYCYTGERASFARVSKELEKLAIQEEEESYLVLYYTGHGYSPKGKLADQFGHQTEFFTFYDSLAIDKEIMQILSRFKHNFKVCMLTDSCYSAGLTDDFKPYDRYESMKSRNELERYIREYMDRFKAVMNVRNIYHDAEIWHFAASSAKNKIPITRNDAATPFTAVVCQILEDVKYDGNHRFFGNYVKKLIAKKWQPQSVGVVNNSSFFDERLPVYFSKKANLKTKYKMNWNISIIQTKDKPVKVTLEPEPDQFKVENINVYEWGDGDIPESVESYVESVFPEENEVEFIRLIGVANQSGGGDVSVEPSDSPLYSIDPGNEETTNSMIVIYHNDNQVCLDGEPIKGKVKNEIGS